MVCAHILIAAGQQSTLPSWQPARQWRKALNVIRTCHGLARLGALSTGVLPRCTSYVAIKIHHEHDSEDDAGFSVAAQDELFKGLVKHKRQDCFHHLGGGAAIAAALESDAERGICGDDGDMQRRREAFGGNTYPRPKPKSFLAHVWDALGDVFLIVLLVCAAVSLGFGIKERGLKDGWYDGVSIFLAVFLVASVSAVNNHGQAKRFDKLASESGNIAVTVVRAARRHEVSIFDIVVGDVVVLKIGDSVPADGVFLEGHGLQVDESSMTGEPHPVEIDAEKSPFLTAGVKIIDGYGRMLVTAVGTDTLWGEMMSRIVEDNTESTPLQEHLEGLTWRIGKIGVAVVVLVFTVLTARHFTGSTKDDQGKPLFTSDDFFSKLAGIIQHAVTIIVVAIPDGLPLAVTLTLAFSMKRMVKENAPVCTLSACEAMGSVTAICTDKTGTLTVNQMKVTEFWVGTQQSTAATEIAVSVVSLLCQGAGINNTGSSVSPTEISGSPSPAEEALQSWAVADLGMDSDALKASFDVLRIEAVADLGMDSDKKRNGVMIRDKATGALIAHWKGAAEMVLANCSMYVNTEGTACELGAEERKKLEKVINDMAVGSLRCIAFAYKQVDSEQSRTDDDGLTLLGFVGLKDQDADTVVTATRWKRYVYSYIRKFIQFQLTVNVAALVINFASAITTGNMWVTPVELLWVNLVMDTMGALTTETPTKARMDRPSIGRTAPLISNALWRSLAAQAFFQIAVLLNAHSHHGPDAGPRGAADQVRLHQQARNEAVRCLPCHCRCVTAEQVRQQVHALDEPDCPPDLDTPEIGIVDDDF